MLILLNIYVLVNRCVLFGEIEAFSTDGMWLNISDSIDSIFNLFSVIQTQVEQF